MAVMLSPLKLINEIEVPQIAHNENKTPNKELASKALARSVYEVLCARYVKNDQIINITIKDDGEDSFNPIKIEVMLLDKENVDAPNIESELTKLYGIDIVINEKTS